MLIPNESLVAMGLTQARPNSFAAIFVPEDGTMPTLADNYSDISPLLGISN